MKNILIPFFLFFCSESLIHFAAIAQAEIKNLQEGPLIYLNGRIEQRVGKDIQAAPDLELGWDGNDFGVVGNLVTINGIITKGWIEGSEVFLMFKTGTIITIKNGGVGGAGTAPIYLRPAQDWEAEAGDKIKLKFMGNSWIELWRID